MNQNIIPDFHKLIERQTENARHHFVKEILKKNEYKTGFVVTRINPYVIRFFPDETKLQEYISGLAEKDLTKAMNLTFIFECRVDIVKERKSIVVNFLS